MGDYSNPELMNRSLSDVKCGKSNIKMRIDAAVYANITQARL